MPFVLHTCAKIIQMGKNELPELNGCESRWTNHGLQWNQLFGGETNTWPCAAFKGNPGSPT